MGGVRLRALREEDDLAVFLGYRSDPLVARYQGWGPMDEAKACAFLREHGAKADLDSAGHWLQLEKPAETTAQLLRFLRARGAGDTAEDLLQEVWITAAAPASAVSTNASPSGTTCISPSARPAGGSTNASFTVLRTRGCGAFTRTSALPPAGI